MDEQIKARINRRLVDKRAETLMSAYLPEAFVRLISWFLNASKAASISSCVHDFEPWWWELDCPVCPLELFSPDSEWPELPDGINPRSSGVIIIILSLSAAFFELTLARSDIWLSMSIVSDESIVCNVSNLILTLSQFWISVNRKRNGTWWRAEDVSSRNTRITLAIVRWKIRGNEKNTRGEIRRRRHTPAGAGSITFRPRWNLDAEERLNEVAWAVALQAEQRKSNRDQLSMIRPIILIPCSPNDRLHFQPHQLRFILHSPLPFISAANKRRSR